MAVDVFALEMKAKLGSPCVFSLLSVGLERCPVESGPQMHLGEERSGQSKARKCFEEFLCHLSVTRTLPVSLCASLCYVCAYLCNIKIYAAVPLWKQSQV